MKRILLNIALLLGTAATSFAQFTFTPSTSAATGVTLNTNGYANGQATPDCNTTYIGDPTVAKPGTFYAFQSYNGVSYTDAACTNTIALGAGIGGGNTSDIVVDGSVHYGLNIASSYLIQSWDNACGPVNPSFGFTFATACSGAGNSYNPLSAGANPISVDLSTISSANKKLYINYIGFSTGNTGSLTTGLQFYRDPQNDAGAGAFAGTQAGQPVATFAMDGSTHQIVIDFSGTTVSNAAILAAVRQISFVYYSTTPTTGYDLYFLGFSIGTATPIEPPLATSAKSAAEYVASTKVYPNPVSDMARLELELKSASSVKVTISDLMGKEVMTVAEGTYTELSKEFSVANLNKGMYSVNYFVNGSAAKAEMLMVK